jgi:hypothetical protein
MDINSDGNIRREGSAPYGWVVSVFALFGKWLGFSDESDLCVHIAMARRPSSVDFASPSSNRLSVKGRLWIQMISDAC